MTTYPDIHTFWRMENLPSRKDKLSDWRLADFSVGHLRACPRLRGIACATDGVLLLVKLEDGSIADGHLDNWIIEERSVDARKSTVKKPSKRMLAMQALLKDFIP